MAKISLNVGIRERVGKGASRKNRTSGLIPGIIYGEKKAPTPIEINSKEWVELIKKPGLRTKLFEIKAGKNTEDAMLVDIQYHSVSDKPIHVDFKRIDAKKPVGVSVPVRLVNEALSVGVKAGGVVNFSVRQIALVAKVDNIPEYIEIDLSAMKIGDAAHGKDIKLPSGVSLGLHQADLAFVAITGKEEEKEVAPAAASVAPAAGAAAAAPAAAAGAKPAPGAAPAAKPAPGAAPKAAAPAAKPAAKK
ncbi:MAG: 50S ribosomal protein L25/general stress protein Ctc [Rickettsiales bacterium]|jgi:large subunit ribosomal protein L25|nr:50S ribosomal protein L25/general stress protein Ctc [Rickettsiales bacterium]